MFDGGDRVVKALRARMGRRLKIMVGDITFLPVPFVVDLAGPAARGLYLATSDIEGGQGDLKPSARRFLRDFVGGEFGTPQQYVNHAADATEVVLVRSPAPTGRGVRARGDAENTVRTDSWATTGSIATGTSLRRRSSYSGSPDGHVPATC